MLFVSICRYLDVPQTASSYYIDSIIGRSPDCNFEAGNNLHTSGSLKINLYTLSGNMLASVQVSTLAVKYLSSFSEVLACMPNW